MQSLLHHLFCYQYLFCLLDETDESRAFLQNGIRESTGVHLRQFIKIFPVESLCENVMIHVVWLLVKSADILFL